MNTNNIISTPDITGNIGSCETKMIEGKTGDSVMTSQKTIVFTNSCTGQVVRQQTYTDYGVFTFISVMGILLGILIFWIIIGMSLEKDNNVTRY